MQLTRESREIGPLANMGVRLNPEALGAFVLPVTERASGSSTVDRSFSCELLKEISRGPLGSVWLGRITTGHETGRLVTVRRVPLAHLAASERDAIKAAARVSTTLAHPSLVKVLRAYEQDGELSVVSEHIEGVHLRVLRRLAADSEQPLPAEAAVRIVLDILRASGGARAQMATGRQRRLLYTEGALVACFGETLLGDVGVLSELANSAHARLDAELAAQLAPEELLGGPSDERAEVFAAGVLLWELVANRRLFSASSAPDVRRQLIRCEVPGLAGVASVPEEVAQIVVRATAREPQARFLTVSALLKALSAVTPDRTESERQVRLCVEQLAGPFLAACRRSVDLPAARQTDEPDVPWSTPSVRPTLSSGAEFPAEESPTVPARRLVVPMPAVIPVSLPARPSPLPPVTPASAATAMPGGGLQSVATTLPPDLVPRQRPRRALLGAAAGLGLIASIALLLLRPTASLSPAPERVSTAAEPSKAAAGEGSARSARQPAAGERPIMAPPDAAGAGAVSEPAVAEQHVPSEARVHASVSMGPDAGIPDSGTSQSSVGSDPSRGSSRRNFRPRSIEPYRPRGI
jgi:eukaryotic-like serine/threonine-protein kinase